MGYEYINVCDRCGKRQLNKSIDKSLPDGWIRLNPHLEICYHCTENFKTWMNKNKKKMNGRDDESI